MVIPAGVKTNIKDCHRLTTILVMICCWAKPPTPRHDRWDLEYPPSCLSTNSSPLLHLQVTRTVSWRTWSVPGCCLPPPPLTVSAGQPRSPPSWSASAWGQDLGSSSSSMSVRGMLRPGDCPGHSTACRRSRTPGWRPAPAWPPPGPSPRWSSSRSRSPSAPGRNSSPVSSGNWRHLSGSDWEVSWEYWIYCWYFINI